MRRNRYDILLPVGLLLACFSVIAAGAVRWQQFPISLNADRQESPDVHGTIVVWHQFVRQFGDYDIYVADINNPADPKVLIIGDANDQVSPAIYDYTVAWQDYVVVGSYADWDIRMADLSDWANPQTYAVSNLADSDELSPTVQGDTILWHSDPPADHDIDGAAVTDPSNPVLFTVTDYQFEQQNAAAYRTIVVWQDNYYGDWDIYAADIWQKNKPAEFPVSLLQADQTNPAIFADIVVWQDNRSGTWNIYAAVLDGAEIAKCTTSLPADTNNDCRIDFTDFAAMASAWLECGLAPAQACGP